MTFSPSELRLWAVVADVGGRLDTQIAELEAFASRLKVLQTQQEAIEKLEEQKRIEDLKKKYPITHKVRFNGEKRWWDAHYDKQKGEYLVYFSDFEDWYTPEEVE